MAIHFIGMSLRHLAVLLPPLLSLPRETVQLLSSLTERAPLLKYLEIKGSPDIANVTFHAALSLPKLDTLLTEGFAIPMACLPPFARLDHLRVLSLKLNEDTPLENIRANYIPAFHSLEAIHLNTTIPYYATSFILRFLVGSPLREFSLESSYILDQEEARHLVFAMAQSFPHESTTTIRVWCSENTEALPGDRMLVLDASILRKLFVFRHLKTFTFNVDMLYKEVDDKFIADLITSWPALRGLSLVPSGRTPYPAINLTFEGLEHFTRSRNLTYLAVLLDSSNCSLRPKYPPANGSSCSSLRHLDVHASTYNIRDLGSLSSLISDLFPNLEDGIKSLGPSIEEFDVIGCTSAWGAVSARYR
ncbi:hypothetical protein HWV62_727 [Athelia sp. TMB]|nr:hypothetical protein HWV62_727 [Athelia sp. TMB]